ncbi:uncharacterized protein N7477_001673 [Penicillium maclennaniae]|uniref:uncharacterized protein n=1 Tax=Penicillium maclennaniae TaxID=1343394 RepID=UPI0025405984|nr:uncharacterized protein N7477_001673 [Penicillium maclennaniae]KAJ5681733.1 hypothetical protein N7477_001673 [Penicillium maclennaniae]
MRSSPSGGLSSSQQPSYTYSSADLSGAPYLDSMTPSGSASATESAILKYGATASPSAQPWGTLTVLPSGTVTGTTANSDATNIAFFLKGFYNNIGQLKTDPGTYKSNLEDVEKESEDYLSKVNYVSSKSPCSGSLRKRSLFGAIGSLASSAANVATGALDEATSIVEDALSCIGPVADSMIKTIPDDISEVTDDVEGTVKKGAEYLNEISDIILDLLINFFLLVLHLKHNLLRLHYDDYLGSNILHWE